MWYWTRCSVSPPKLLSGLSAATLIVNSVSPPPWTRKGKYIRCNVCRASGSNGVGSVCANASSINLALLGSVVYPTEICSPKKSSAMPRNKPFIESGETAEDAVLLLRSQAIADRMDSLDQLGGVLQLTAELVHQYVDRSFSHNFVVGMETLENLVARENPSVP